MKELSEVVACVIDRGTFFPVAERLARDYAKVYYSRPVGEAFPTACCLCPGDGNEKVHYLPDFWSAFHEIDIFVFPDCTDAALQGFLEKCGKPVWGSKSVGPYESRRGKWMDVCETVGLPMPPTEKISGLSKLRRYLDEHEGEGLFVKISVFRGDMETWQAKTKQQTGYELDKLAMRLGPIQDHVTFYVQEPVDTQIEGGADTYNIHGRYPDKIVLGYENKDQAMLSAVKNRDDMPEEIWSPSEKITELLSGEGYANFISSEVRVGKDGKSYWLDPCFRFASPGGEDKLELYKNFSEIVYEGAHGRLVQPEFSGQFSGAAAIAHTQGDDTSWKAFVIPHEVQDSIKLYANVEVDGACHFPPNQKCDCLGWAIAVGDTPVEVLNKLHKIGEALEGQPVELKITPMADLIQEVAEAEKQGIDFTDKKMPKPADVLK